MQARGLVIDNKEERIVCFPYTHAAKFQVEWPVEESPTGQFIHMFVWEDKVHFTAENSFENKVKTNSFDFC